MTLSIVQSAFNTGLSPTWTLATEDNLLLLFVSIKAPDVAGAYTPPSGWEIGRDGYANGNAVGGVLMAKRSDGTETGATLVDHGADHSSRMVEVTSSTANDPEIDGTGDDQTNLDTVVQTQDSGEVTTVEANTMLLAFITDTDRRQWQATENWTPTSFVEENSNGAGGSGIQDLAKRTVTSAAAYSVTETTTDNGDEAYGAIVAIHEEPPAGADQPYNRRNRMRQLKAA